MQKMRLARIAVFLAKAGKYSSLSLPDSRNRLQTTFPLAPTRSSSQLQSRISTTLTDVTRRSGGGWTSLPRRRPSLSAWPGYNNQAENERTHRGSTKRPDAPQPGPRQLE